MKQKIWMIIALVEAVLIIAGAIFSVIMIKYLKNELDASDKAYEASYQQDTAGLDMSLIKNGDTVIGVKIVWPDHIFRSKTAEVIIRDKDFDEVYHYHYNIFHGYVIEEIEAIKYIETNAFPGWTDETEAYVCKTDGEGNELCLYLPPDTYEGYAIEADFLNQGIVIE
ncbi:MAG: hypothetical protein IJS17_02210 [Clostridia bacterium]|nr:hypothetical protein [Clostridia bacterium]